MSGSDSGEVMRLRNEVRSLRGQISAMEQERRAFDFLVEKTLLEESPVMGALRDCFPLLKLVPPELVQQHAALVKSTDDFDNATYPYFHAATNTVFLFKCFKEHNLFSKDKCIIQMYVMRAKGSAASRGFPAPVPVPSYTPAPTGMPPGAQPHHPHPHHHPHHPHGQPPAGYPAQGQPPAGYPAQGQPPAGYPAQGQPPAGYPSQPPGAYPPQGAAPPGAYPPQGAAPPPAGYPAQGQPPSGFPPGAYPPGAYPPGAYPPGAYPPGQPASHPGYPPQQPWSS
jgi:hypothetical protein